MTGPGRREATASRDVLIIGYGPVGQARAGRHGGPVPVLSDELRAGLRRIGARVVRFVAPGDAATDAGGTMAEAGPGAADLGDAGADQVAVDVDGFYLPWLRQAGYEAFVARPDFYFFGAAEKAADVPALLRELFGKLDLIPPDNAAGLTTRLAGT